MSELVQAIPERRQEGTAGDHDLRSWLARVEAAGELTHLRGLHWDLEIGAACEALHRSSAIKSALLFDQIPGYPQGYRVAANLFSSLKRIALTLDMPEPEDEFAFMRAWRDRRRSWAPIPPQEVSDGPILENVQEGDAIDLDAFPSPKWHQHDGGRYIGTACVILTRDPDSGWVNLGTYRACLQSRDTVSLYISPGKHGRLHRDRYWDRGRPCPVVLSFGQTPALFLVSASESPPGMSEYDLAGAMVGSPVPVIRGSYTGLPIPAYAEIVAEGEMVPGDLATEGPFGEWTGYSASSSGLEPLVRVKRLLFRHNPIITGHCAFRPPNAGSLWRALIKSSLVWESLEGAGVPDVRGVWTMEAGGSNLILVVSIKQRYAGHANQAGLVASQCGPGIYLNRYVIVVDDDIDPTDTDQVLWAVATRSDPERSINIIRNCLTSRLDPALPEGQKTTHSRAIIDACKPYSWRDQFPLVADAPEELKRSVLAKIQDQLADAGGART